MCDLLNPSPSILSCFEFQIFVGNGSLAAGSSILEIQNDQSAVLAANVDGIPINFTNQTFLVYSVSPEQIVSTRPAIVM